MLVPKLFRWIFFRKKLVETTFDALRHKDTLYVDTSIQLRVGQKAHENSIHLNEQNLNEFIERTPKEQLIVLFGNNRNSLNKIHNQLDIHGFQKVFNVGSVEELIKIKDQIK